MVVVLVLNTLYTRFGPRFEQQAYQLLSSFSDYMEVFSAVLIPKTPYMVTGV